MNLYLPILPSPVLSVDGGRFEMYIPVVHCVVGVCAVCMCVCVCAWRQSKAPLNAI